VPPSEKLRTTVTRAARALAETVVDARSSEGDDAPAMLPPLPGVGDVVGQHYRLVRLLGQGMFGKVYAAERVDVPEHQVALKLMPRSLYAGRNVERELVMLATVGHPHVVQMKDHGTTDDYVWLTMPVYVGETLGERLESGPLDLREAHDIFLPIARALEALHGAGLRHQDIKPENIFLARFGGRLHPVLLDLGVAAERDASFVAGTALYAAPEQLLAFTGVPGAIPLTEKMDTYCLGATLLTSLVGPAFFPGEQASSRDEIAEAHDERAREPLRPGALPSLVGEPREALARTLRGLLALDPADRPTMSDVAEQLDVLLEPERETARAEARQKTRQRLVVQRLRRAVVALVVLATAVVGVAYNKRETLRLAGELERARIAGARSFDKLDTCTASYRVARGEIVACRADLDHDRAEFQRTLRGLSSTGDKSQAEHAREVQALQTSYASRMKVCEDAQTESEKAVAASEARASECEAARVALGVELDEQKALVEAKLAEIDKLQSEHDELLAEERACVAERDACVATKAPAPAETASAAPSASGPLPSPSAAPPSASASAPPLPVPSASGVVPATAPPPDDLP
jgi:hypothetical protein